MFFFSSFFLCDGSGPSWDAGWLCGGGWGGWGGGVGGGGGGSEREREIFFISTVSKNCLFCMFRHK